MLYIRETNSHRNRYLSCDFELTVAAATVADRVRRIEEEEKKTAAKPTIQLLRGDNDD